MARGRQQHQARLSAVAGMGRQLSRRARNRCELCQSATSLTVVEIPPVDPEEPSEDRAAMLCARCVGLVGGKPLEDPNQLRFLEESIWSEVIPVQLAAVRLIRRLADDGVGWAVDALDVLYMDPDVEQMVAAT
jgi:protein PhnA